MQNRILGRACFPAGLVAARPQQDQASAAPVTFRKDRLDIRACSIDIVSCVMSPSAQRRLLYDTTIQPFGKQASEGDLRTL